MKKVGDNIKSSVGGFNFSGKVHKTFDKHVKKSVPFYEVGHDLICKLSSFFLVNKSVVYDLGCSTGKLTRNLYEYNKDIQIKIFGIDAEPEMIKHSLKSLNQKTKKFISYRKSELTNLKLKKSDLIISYYTIQFIKPKFRQKIFDKIYESLNFGGAFILFEKIRGSDARFQDIFTQIYHEFKVDQGFSKDEIYNKSTSIRGVLEPFTSKANVDYMKRAGFKDIISIIKYCNFEGFLAIK
jgi:tRNA (cmo5U34)-methyltransferase